MRTIVSKDKLVDIAEFVTRVLEDLREDQLADWAKGMATLIENEQYQDLVMMLDEVVNRLTLKL